MTQQPMFGLVYPAQIKPEVWANMQQAAFDMMTASADGCSPIPAFDASMAWTNDAPTPGKLDGVTYILFAPVSDPSALVLNSPCVQKLTQKNLPFGVVVHEINPRGRLYHPSVVADPHSRHAYGYAVPSSWMADNGTAGTLWLEGMDKPMTPLMGAVQFFCSWVDDLELDESVADIERIVAIAANYDDLFTLQRGEYLPLEYLPVRDNHALEALEAWTQATITHLNEMLDK